MKSLSRHTAFKFKFYFIILYHAKITQYTKTKKGGWDFIPLQIWPFRSICLDASQINVLEFANLFPNPCITVKKKLLIKQMWLV